MKERERKTGREGGEKEKRERERKALKKPSTWLREHQLSKHADTPFYFQATAAGNREKRGSLNTKRQKRGKQRGNPPSRNQHLFITPPKEKKEKTKSRLAKLQFKEVGAE